MEIRGQCRLNKNRHANLRTQRVHVTTPAQRRGKKRATVALARRIGIVLHRMWRDETEFRFTKELVAPAAAEPTGASHAAVQRNLAWMEARGLISEVTGQGRYRMWRARAR